ncbi:hypothetical protein L1987_39172 [Smallanthus sonchifolius]|uniref:Uncharacterized protein n=1 Tax=Smallanthus sonchifolius TaxID=185202 RepID=A0ACB9HLA4_9ASTR|nr:hypothetical protein L1987_39172 [Smallanthus sonchifolius]
MLLVSTCHSSFSLNQIPSMTWLSLFSLLTLLTVVAASPPPVTTMPAFPEQSDASGCPLDLPADLFRNVKSACTGKHAVRRSTCCPVLAAWLYSAYSVTALGKTVKQKASYYYDIPLLPNDSETCVDTVENRLRSNGIELVRANESCDVVYCECGIRLHQLSCTEAFSVNSAGDLVGNQIVQKLEKDCLGVGACTKCLKTLRLLNTSRSVERGSKMHSEDCELMGLTWLLAKNRSAYINTVSGVLRATMMNTDSCTAGLPLAVDSSEINASSSSSSSVFFHSLLTLCLLLFFMHQPFDHSM